MTQKVPVCVVLILGGAWLVMQLHQGKAGREQPAPEGSCPGPEGSPLDTVHAGEGSGTAGVSPVIYRSCDTSRKVTQ